MKDKNGIEIHTGDIVKIENAFFKNDNGFWFVTNSAGDPNWSGSDYCLHKIGKNGKVSTARHHTAFYPLVSFCSDSAKNAEAKKWNDDNAVIEVVDTIPSDKVGEYFEKKAGDIERRIPRLRMDFGKEHPYVQMEVKTFKFYKKVAAKCQK